MALALSGVVPSFLPFEYTFYSCGDSSHLYRIFLPS